MSTHDPRDFPRFPDIPHQSFATGGGFEDPSQSPYGGPGPVLTIPRPPLGYLAASALTVLAAAALLIGFRSQPWGSGLAWLLAGPINVLIIGAFIGEDHRRRAGSIYEDLGWPNVAYKVLLLLGAVVASLASWFFADWAGRL